MTVSDWLAGLGLSEYAERFEAEALDMALLATLTEADLQALGVAPLGHRRRLLDAIAAFDLVTPLCGVTDRPRSARAPRLPRPGRRARRGG